MIKSLIIKEVVLPTTNIYHKNKNIYIKLTNTFCDQEIPPDKMLELLKVANNLIREEDDNNKISYLNYTLRLDP